MATPLSSDTGVGLVRGVHTTVGVQDVERRSTATGEISVDQLIYTRQAPFGPQDRGTRDPAKEMRQATKYQLP